MVEIGKVNPAIVQIGSDILLQNVSAPGMDILAERERARLFQAGMIPQNQWTDEEKAQVQQQQALAAQQPQEKTPEQMIGEAELIKAQNEQAETQIGVQVKGAEIQLKGQKEQREDFVAQSEQQRKDVTAQNDLKNDQIDRLIQVQTMQSEQSANIIKEIKTQAETLALIAKAIGADAIITPGTQQAFEEQTAQLLDSQEQN